MKGCARSRGWVNKLLVSSLDNTNISYRYSSLNDAFSVGKTSCPLMCAFVQYINQPMHRIKYTMNSKNLSVYFIFQIMYQTFNANELIIHKEQNLNYSCIILWMVEARKVLFCLTVLEHSKLKLKLFNKNCRIARNIKIGKIEYGKVLEGLGFRL